MFDAFKRNAILPVAEKGHHPWLRIEVYYSKKPFRVSGNRWVRRNTKKLIQDWGYFGDDFEGRLPGKKKLRLAFRYYTWPLYAVAQRAKTRAPAALLVVTFDEAVAKWASKPIDIGQPCSSFMPVVLGPKAIPYVFAITLTGTESWIMI
jgi:hypothetical protein